MDIIPLDSYVAEEAASVALGSFDGVHRGHRHILAAAQRGSMGTSDPELPLMVFTFRNHPMEVLRGAAPPLLTSFEEKAALLAGCGVDVLVWRDFDAEFARL
jgi:riboflavin kinase/FMN adenylyltransferase